MNFYQLQRYPEGEGFPVHTIKITCNGHPSSSEWFWTLQKFMSKEVEKGQPLVTCSWEFPYIIKSNFCLFVLQQLS